MEPEEEMLLIGEVAKLLNVHRNTLKKWDRDGVLPAYRLGPKRIRRYRRQEVLEFAGIRKEKQ